MSMSLNDFDLKGDKFVPPDPGVPGPSRPVAEEPESQPEKPEAGTKEITTLAKTLQALNEEVVQDRQNARLLADPVIRDYLEAKQRGVRVKLVGTEQEIQQTPVVQTQEPQPSQEDLETMTNAQLVGHLNKTLATSLSKLISDQVTKAVGGLRQEITPTLESVAAHTQQQQSARIAQDIEAVRTKYKDFEQLRPVMAELNKNVQGVSVEQLYMLAKMQSGVPMVTQPQVETERPNQPPNQRRGAKTPVMSRGRAGFQNLLGAVLEQE